MARTTAGDDRGGRRDGGILDMADDVLLRTHGVVRERCLALRVDRGSKRHARSRKSVSAVDDDGRDLRRDAHRLGRRVGSAGVVGFSKPSIAGRRPNFRLGVYLAAAATAGVVTYLTVLSVWEGGIGPALDTLVATSRRVRSLWDRTFVEWLRAVGGHVVQLFGWPATVVTAAILIKSVMRPRGFLAAHVVAWFLLCTFNIAMAPKRAFNHEFWWYYLTPAVTVAVAITADALWRRHRRVLALMFVFVCLIPAAWRTIERYKETAPPAGPAARFLEIVDGFTTEDDLLAISAYPAPWMYYCKPWLYVVRSEETILEHVDRYRSGALGRNRRFFFILANVLLETQPNVRRRLDTESVMKQSVPEYTIYELRRPPKRATSR